MAQGKKTAEKRNGISHCSAQCTDSSSFVMGLGDEFGLRRVSQQQPPPPGIFYEARLWATKQFYVREVLKLRKGIFNYGFNITAASGKKKDIAAVDQWKLDYDTVISNFVRDTWIEWLAMDNAVALWRSSSKRPLILSCEGVRYTDHFAVEKLRITHGLDQATIDEMKLSKAEEEELKGGEIELVKQGDNYTKKSFFFEVVKREKVGMGLAWPSLRSIFNPANGIEALQVGDRQLADTLRTVYELHQVGHEIKNGPLSGRSAHFLKKIRADSIKSQIKQDKKLLSRLIQLIVNFDHNVTYPRPKPEVFASSRYDAFMDQLVAWSMPVGQMIFAKGVNPFLMTLLKAQATDERGEVGPFIRRVLTKSLKPPSPITVGFSEDVFWDSRLMLDVLKTALAAGPLSQETFLTKTGFSAARERELKEEESKLPKGVTHPTFDAAHGDKPPGPKPGSSNTK